MGTTGLYEGDLKLAHSIAKAYLPVVSAYHRAEFIGMENIPENAFLAVGNHSGMHFMPESMLWLSKYHSEHRQVGMYTLIHRFTHHFAEMLHIPLAKLGLLEANKENAASALRQGFAITVYPAGDRDNAKPFWDRNKIDFFHHKGYIKLALDANVPIVPIVGVGGGETVFTVASGEKLAEWTGLSKHLKVHTWPLYWSFPFGWHLGHIPKLGLPLPSQITISVLEPIHVEEHARAEADDPYVVDDLNDLVVRKMQEEVDRLVKDRIPIIGDMKKDR